MHGIIHNVHIIYTYAHKMSFSIHIICLGGNLFAVVLPRQKKFEHVIIMVQFALLANCVCVCVFCVLSSKWYKKLNRELFDIGALWCIILLFAEAFCAK